MKNLNIKIYIGLVVLISLILWVGVSLMTDKSTDVKNEVKTEIQKEDSSDVVSANPLAPKKLTPIKAYANVSSDWTWIKTTYTVSGWASAQPKKVDDFILTMNEDKTISLKADCNQITGNYSLKENTISGEESPDELVLGGIAMTPGVSTQKFCEWSVEQSFLKDLHKVSSYNLRTNELDLILQNNQGTMKFQRKITIQS